jgi:enoyl-CoA hydratase/carnithine racemase
MFPVQTASTEKKGWLVRVADTKKPCVISREFVRQLAALVEKAENEKDLLHLTILMPTYFGKRGKISLSGGDLDEMITLSSSPDEQLSFFVETKQCFTRLQQLECITSVCFDGTVIGGGVEFLAAFDLRWSTVDSLVWCPQIFNGLCSGFGGEITLTQKFGRGFAELLLYSGKKCEPKDLPAHFYADSTAQSYGQLEGIVGEYLKKLDTTSLKALQWQKRSLDKANGLDLSSEILQNEAYAAFLEQWAKR